jgi:hypothetical protein
MPQQRELNKAMLLKIFTLASFLSGGNVDVSERKLEYDHRIVVTELVGPGRRHPNHTYLSKASANVLISCCPCSEKGGHNRVGTIHLLLECLVSTQVLRFCFLTFSE